MTRATILVLGIAIIVRTAAAGDTGKEMPVFTHGFRQDPLAWAETSESVEAALVRRNVTRRPLPGDDAVLQKRIDEVLGKQKPDGHLADDIKGTAERLIQLVELGVDARRPEVQKVARLLLAERTEEHSDNHRHISVRGTRALILLGITDPPEVRQAVATMVEREKVWSGAWKLCPWGTQLYLDALWEGRDLVNTRPVVKRTLTWIAREMNAAGCVSYKDPWSFVNCAGRIDTPDARRVVAKLVPMLLRAQKPDGGWGGQGYIAFRALATHGFLEPLRKLPPLPPDWRIVRSIPAPCEEARWLAFDGEGLWTLDRAAAAAYAVSPEDGAVRKKLKLPFPKPGAIGVWDGGLGVIQDKPKRLIKLDPETGRIAGELSLASLEWPMGFAQRGGQAWVYDAWMGCIMKVDPEEPGKRHFHGHTGGGSVLTAVGDSVACVQDFAPLILRTHVNGKLLDWGEVPFAGGCRGLAWDGQRLWALDAKAKRICTVERSTTPEAN